MKKTMPGINVQAPWAELIASGAKTVETRFYRLSEKYIGKEMALVETPGKSGGFNSRVIAVITFGESFPYRDRTHFYSDSRRHLVTPDSGGVSWEAGNGKRKWGWPITRVRRLRREIPKHIKRGIIYALAIPV